MNDPQVLLASPRFRGIQEHLSRATFLLDIARTSDAIATYRLQLAAIYSCRAVVELLLEAADKQEVRNPSEPTAHWTRKELEDYMLPKLPFYSLVERIRIHDFHRFGVIPPNQGLQETFLGGPMKLVAKKGAVAVVLGANGPVKLTSGNSEVKEQRPLLNHDGRFFDDDSSCYVALDDILEKFIGSAHAVVVEIAANSA
jgi:hypothetical protein